MNGYSFLFDKLVFEENSDSEQSNIHELQINIITQTISEIKKKYFSNKEMI